MQLRERIARAIWEKRPDQVGKPWPESTHYPIAARDLCYIYADAALRVINEEQAGALAAGGGEAGA